MLRQRAANLWARARTPLSISAPGHAGYDEGRVGRVVPGMI